MQPHIRRFVERAVTFQTCPDCDGTRLTPEARKSKINGKSIADLCEMQISDLADWVRDLDEPSVAPLLKGLQHLLDSFSEIGLGYLSLDRPAGTLSGGEAQRTKMIRHLGSSLTDVTYVFDEPTIGLHPHDIERMNNLLLQLRDKGNTVLVVEHKPETIAHRRPRRRHRPGGRRRRAAASASRATSTACAASDTITGKHLDDRARLKESVREPSGTMEVRGASTHNLRDVDVDVPARPADRRHRRRRVGQELADPRLAGRPRRGHRHRPGRDQGVAPQQPGDVHRSARADPQGLRQGQRRQAGALQLQLRGRLPDLQRRRRDLHRARSDGDRRVAVRGVRGPPLQGRGARAHPGRQGHRRGARDVGRRRAGALQRRRGQDPGRGEDPRPARRRRAWATSRSASR